MSRKRGANIEINHENWDQELQSEDAGQFTQADQNALRNRAIKTAKRRLDRTVDNETTAPSAFSTFSGFGCSASTGTNEKNNPFSFLANKGSEKGSEKRPSGNVGAQDQFSPVGNKRAKEDLPSVSYTTSQTHAEPSSNKPSVTCEETKTPNISKDCKEPDTQEISLNDIYKYKLGCLNVKFVEWIVQHIKENPHYILTPVFEDYISHLKHINDERDGKVPCEFVSEMAHSPETSEPTSDQFIVSFRDKVENEREGATPAKDLINTEDRGWKNVGQSQFANFRSNAMNESIERREYEELKSEGQALFASLVDQAINKSIEREDEGSRYRFASLGNNAKNVSKIRKNDGSPSTSASRNGSTSHSPSSAGFSTPRDLTPSYNSDSEDEEIPKKAVKNVKEDGAIYEKRVKLFVKSNGQYETRGVGVLFLKLVGDGTKTQIIVRSDDALAKLMLNILFNEDTPLQRLNKNSVMVIACPDADSPPTAILFRVKTEEEGTDLMTMLGKCQSGGRR